MISYENLALELLRLNEDAETDQYFRQKARAIYNNLLEYLKGDGEFRFSRRTGIMYVLASQFTDEIDNSNLRIEWGLKRGKSGNASYYKKQGAPRIRLKVLDKSELGLGTTEEARKIMIERLESVSDVFLHEIIHYFDDLRTENDLEDVLQYTSGSFKDEKYYSDPVEVNAFFQSALAEFEEFIEDDSHFKFMFEMRWKEDFKRFNKWMFNKVLPGDAVDSIDENQKRRLINRLYGFWQKLENRYEKIKD